MLSVNAIPPAPPVLPNSINGCEMGLREMPSKCQKLIFLRHLRDSTSAGLKINGTQLTAVLSEADIKKRCVHVSESKNQFYFSNVCFRLSLSALKTMRFSYLYYLFRVLVSHLHHRARIIFVGQLS